MLLLLHQADLIFTMLSHRLELLWFSTFLQSHCLPTAAL